MSIRTLVTLAIALLVAAAPAAQADKFQTFAGNTAGGPTWNRPIGGGPSISANLVPYQVQRFKLTMASTCYIYGAQEFDGYLHLYGGGFNPLSQLTNLIDGDDDADLGIGTSQLPSGGGGGLALGAGTYFLVTSGFSAGSFGPFQNSIHCNGTAQPIHGSCGVQFAGFDREQEICLQDRFLVVIGNISNSATGEAIPVRTGSTDTGLFWFYNDKNWEVMVKVLNGCGINGHWWVFIGALTNQRYTVSVADATTLQVNGYSNTLGTRSPAFADTRAFPCP